MVKTYIGRRTLGRTIEGGFHVFVENGETQLPLDPKPSQDIINHSPDGFNWGYGGSGPAQLALGILLDVTGDSNLALRYYHDFKNDCIRGMPDNWKLKEVSVLTWIEKKLFDDFESSLDDLVKDHEKKKYLGVELDLVSEQILYEHWKTHSTLFQTIRSHLEYKIAQKRQQESQKESNS